MRKRTRLAILFMLAQITIFATPVRQEKKLTEEELLTLVQRQTFRYFWDFAHPVSGLARERSNTDHYGHEVVTIGGSGFGIMAIIVGVERTFITRKQGIERMLQIVRFLNKKADHYHGIWPHWINGDTGATIPFSRKDDGADLVETAFMFEGLLAAHQYFNRDTRQEHEIRYLITQLWRQAEWNWFTQGQDVLYWHWSPRQGWAMNHPVKGFNECHIAYILAAASPTYPITADVYHKGWAGDGAIREQMSDREPLFFTHYSYLGLDPRGLKDRYADYWQKNVNHTLANRNYCIENPKGYKGYGENCWGLTASDGDKGYAAHCPENDCGVITPTAALSAFPYTPDYSMQALCHFYYGYNGKLWGKYGFKDAFNPDNGWVASSFLAIDQGPIIVMIENYRTGLIWNLFMSHPDVRNGLQKLGFTSPHFENKSIN